MPNDFERIDEANEETFGPCAVLLCGFDPRELAPVGILLDRLGVEGCRVLFCSREMLGMAVGPVLEEAEQGTPLPPKKLPRTMLLSGMNGEQVQTVVQSFGATGLMRPIFATVTKINYRYTVKELLSELLREHRAMQKQQMDKKVKPAKQ
jgi:Domain of unknown function (DUF3783)